MFVVPDTALHFSNVASSQKKHQQTRDADATAKAKGKSVLKNRLHEWQLCLMLHSSMSKLSTKALTVNSNACTHKLVPVFCQGMLLFVGVCYAFDKSVNQLFIMRSQKYVYPDKSATVIHKNARSTYLDNYISIEAPIIVAR